MPPSASAAYKFARDPAAAIRTSVQRQLEEKSDNPRVTWNALCKTAGCETTSAIPIPVLAHALKYFGTGIQLTADDLEIGLGSDAPIDFARYSDFVSGYR